MQLIHGDCLTEMQHIPDGSVQLVLADVPYGVTDCKWDSVIPLEPMWRELKRLLDPEGSIVMTACQPFTTKLIASNMSMFRYCWIYHKNSPSGFLTARRRPLNDYEDVPVFSFQSPEYFPQGVKEVRKVVRRNVASEVYRNHTGDYVTTGVNYPRRVIRFQRPTKPVHPTQKPVALMEYLIRTYTLEGETVLDFTMGSGTTGVACVNTRRDFIGIELEKKYYDIARHRIEAATESLAA